MQRFSFDPNLLEAFSRLGGIIRNLTPDEQNELYTLTASENSWFIPENIDYALKGTEKYLTPLALQKWAEKYPSQAVTPRQVGMVMAGNIPMVGLHDLLSVLVCGHNCIIKTSSNDSYLINFLIRHLLDISPDLKTRIEIKDQLKGLDAIIATGSDNSTRYFKYYFSHVPHIFRGNRTGLAIISGEETEEDFKHLADDIFIHFGLGCRNVSKILCPSDFDVEILMNAFDPYNNLTDHHKYLNNYEYQKSILLVNEQPFHDSGYFILKQSSELVSPISMIYYDYYTPDQALSEKIAAFNNKLQVIVSKDGFFPGSISFGEAQFPELWDYADHVDTVRFLLDL